MVRVLYFWAISSAFFWNFNEKVWATFDDDIVQFRQHLKTKDLEKALRFELFFRDSEQPDLQPLFAQYYLYTCQPQKAERAIMRILDLPTKNLFLAVLYGLVSADRSQEDISLRPRSNTRLRGSIIRYIVDDEEIWKDEWADINLVPEACISMPIISELKERERIQKVAREYFARIAAEMLSKNNQIASIARNVGVNRKIIEKTTPHEIKISSVEKNTVELGELILKKAEFKPGPVVIPDVLEVVLDP